MTNQELLEALSGVSFKFWTCKDHPRGLVTWFEEAAVCDECFACSTTDVDRLTFFQDDLKDLLNEEENLLVSGDLTCVEEAKMRKSSEDLENNILLLEKAMDKLKAIA